jgi:hypothetical protein
MWSDKARAASAAARRKGDNTIAAHNAAADLHMRAAGEHAPGTDAHHLHVSEAMRHNRASVKLQMAARGPSPHQLSPAQLHANAAIMHGGPPSQHIVHATPHGTSGSVTPHDHAMAGAHAGKQHGLAAMMASNEVNRRASVPKGRVGGRTKAEATQATLHQEVTTRRAGGQHWAEPRDSMAHVAITPPHDYTGRTPAAPNSLASLPPLRRR